MKKFQTSIVPLVLALLFSLTISLIPTAAVFSDNTPVCVGSSNSSSTLKLGGRAITPTLILRAGGSSYPCLSGESSLSLVSLSRTLMVSPVVSATQNGTALLAAMSYIGSASPSITNPWLLKLEPGQYDLGNQALTLLPYVDLEGSGEGTTTISSTRGTCCTPGTTGTVIMASNTEARFVGVSNTGSNFYQVAVYIPQTATKVRLSNLSVSATGTGRSYGIYNYNSTSTVQNSTISASGGNFTFAVNNSSGTITVENSTLNSTGSNLYSIGFGNSGTATVRNSTITATTGDTLYGLYNENGTLKVQSSSLTATGGTTSYGLYNTGNAMVGASLLSGDSAASSTVGGLTKCPASYDGNFNPLNLTTCIYP